eukprot:1154028-Pelagomonas_calceolata.AAC.12
MSLDLDWRSKVLACMYSSAGLFIGVYANVVVGGDGADAIMTLWGRPQIDIGIRSDRKVLHKEVTVCTWRSWLAVPIACRQLGEPMPTPQHTHGS